MTFDIQLIIEGDITSNDVSITVDDNLVDATVENNLINISTKLVGLHILKLTNNTNKKFKILQAKINGCDLRKLIYLSYIENKQGEKRQPATELWEEQQTWVLPFGYPVSRWIETVEEKIPNGGFGQSLIDNFYFYFPESIKLKNFEFPQIIKDFYEYNFNFTVLDKLNPDVKKIPYVKYQKEISKELINAASIEVSNNLDFCMENGLVYGQRNENLKEFQTLSKESEWKLVWLARNRKTVPNSNKLLAVQKLIDSLNLDIWHSFIGVLPPGGFIYPHVDMYLEKINNTDYTDYQGCTQLYIPLCWPAGNFIKFAGAGTLSFKSNELMVINNDFLTHCVVNDSTQYRYILAVRAHKDILKDCVFDI